MVLLIVLSIGFPDYVTDDRYQDDSVKQLTISKISILWCAL